MVGVPGVAVEQGLAPGRVEPGEGVEAGALESPRVEERRDGATASARPVIASTGIATSTIASTGSARQEEFRDRRAGGNRGERLSASRRMTQILVGEAGGGNSPPPGASRPRLQ
jgi:hypothetical protein